MLIELLLNLTSIFLGNKLPTTSFLPETTNQCLALQVEEGNFPYFQNTICPLDVSNSDFLFCLYPQRKGDPELPSTRNFRLKHQKFLGAR